MTFDIEKVAESFLNKTSLLKKEIFGNTKEIKQTTISDRDKQTKIDNYERNDSLSIILAERLSSDTLTESIEKNMAARKKSMSDKTLEDLKQIREINEKSLKEMGKK